VRRALAALFGGAVGKDTVSRTWRKVKSVRVPGDRDHQFQAIVITHSRGS
jgi:hypothetical protein